MGGAPVVPTVSIIMVDEYIAIPLAVIGLVAIASGGFAYVSASTDCIYTEAGDRVCDREPRGGHLSILTGAIALGTAKRLYRSRTNMDHADRG